MGLTSSTPTQTNEEKQLDNIKKLFNNNDDTDDILESLNITEFKQENVDGKKPLPMVGGYGSGDVDTTDMDSSKLQRKRYTKYDLFKMLKDLDSEFQTGGNDGDDKDESSLDDKESMDNIKKVILKELQNLKENKSQQLGGLGCGCDSSGEQKNGLKSKFSLNNVVVEEQLGGNIIVDDSSSSTSSSSSDSEAGKKSKKNYKKEKEDEEDEDKDDDEESSRFFIQTSESDDAGMTSNGPNKKTYKKKSNTKSKKQSAKKSYQNYSEDSEGLSIFPFNSSDVKSSQSIQNFRNLRRRI